MESSELRSYSVVVHLVIEGSHSHVTSTSQSELERLESSLG